MLEEKGNLWELDGDARCITTNGTIKNDGRAVMGRGVALQAATLYPTLSLELGQFLNDYGNVLAFWGEFSLDLFTFPVKHDWWISADIELIKRSCTQLINLLDDTQVFHRVLLPAPGCGNGGLAYEEVLPVIRPLLDDRVVVVSMDNGFVPYSYMEAR